jgi:hypothetical protein
MVRRPPEKMKFALAPFRSRGNAVLLNSTFREGSIMQDTEEKRRGGRLACRSPVAWAYFNKPETHQGQMLNYSRHGVCFECAQALVRGATVLVRLNTYPAECRSSCQGGPDCPWPPSIVLADVKWCRDLSGNGASRFGVGVKFHLEVGAG